MKIHKLIAIALSLTLATYADTQNEEREKTMKELKIVNYKYALKERELRAAGKGSPELQAKAREAFAEFLKAMEEHEALKSYVEKREKLKTELEAAIRDGDDKNRESALMAIEELKGEQLQAALEIPELRQLKEQADKAIRKAQAALVESDAEAQKLLAKRQELIDRLSDLPHEGTASE